MKKSIITIACTTLMLTMVLTGCGSDGSSGAPGSSNSEVQGAVSANPTPMPWGGTSGSEDLMLGVTAREVVPDTGTTDGQNVKIMDFSLRLFQHSLQDGENVMISPLSVLSALGMAANGADNETLAQMEEIFGLSREELNQYLHAYINRLPQGEKYKLAPANAIWFRDSDDLSFEETFLQTNADWYGAGIYRAPFDDSTLKEINEWVNANTDGMIHDILDEIPLDAVMYLVNALAFDAEWNNIYKDFQIYDGIFTAADGTEQEAELMYSEETCYLEDENATGFVKYYADKAYAFVALLPNEGISPEDYVGTLTGEQLSHLLSDSQNTMVNVTIPKFQCEYKTEMSDTLKSMGMTNAFDAAFADFSQLGHSSQGNLFVGRVLHKTYIVVDEKGTKAGAATAVEMQEEGAPLILYSVYLDRPFVYLLIDCSENLPVFIGVLNHLEP